VLRHTSLIAAIAAFGVTLPSCGNSRLQPNDKFYSKTTNELEGVVIEVASHRFENGLEVQSVHYRRAADGKDAWMPVDVLKNGFTAGQK
jgi:hypothetical protein